MTGSRASVTLLKFHYVATDDKGLWQFKYVFLIIPILIFLVTQKWFFINQKPKENPCV